MRSKVVVGLLMVVVAVFFLSSVAQRLKEAPSCSAFPRKS